MESALTDLVTDTKFRVEFKSDLVYRFTFQSSDSRRRIVRREEKKEVWKEEKPVGSGSYGSIWAHKCLTSEDQGELQAVKKISRKSLSSDGIDFFKELEAIAKFSQRKYHGLFVEYFGWYENDDSVFIVMEYLQRGDLGSCLKMPLPEIEAREITFQIAEGLQELHENGFVHRDLKPQNIFIVKPGPKWWVKIGDFGFSKRVKENSSLRSMVGTRLFLAPEVQMIYPPRVDETSAVFRYSTKVDIWSLGVMVFYILFHEFPFTLKDPHGLPKYVRGGELPFPTSPIAQTLSEESRKFMRATMAPDASSRLSARGVLESDWLKQRHINPAPSVEDTFIRLSELGETLCEQHKYIEAEETLRRAFEGRTETLGTAHEHTLTTLEWLGKSLYFLEDYAKAVAAFHEAAESRKMVLGKHSENTLTSLNWLGRAHYWHEDYPKAEAALREAVEGRKMVLGEQHESTLYSLEWLGRALYYHEDYAKAEEAFRQAAEGRKMVLGMDNEETLTSFEWLGRALYYHKDYAKAEAVFRLTFKGRKAVLGIEHAHSWGSLEWLGRSIH
ncbi:hypothetical protein N7537_004182 [Penicillium hordei]|uniref:Serine/threonine-protein kinase ATG1 n=1 Tax=Penicillium hordei TaxID=40994 RepID=A0AAD6EAU0_9EURO|nr:uncharacterized protein N7537_004182 [Penicillium hordei]KAJ5607563.1 hypothetical protein N7537_004182 [Penicillium hordei]